ncbi:MAG: UDP-N-acetylmuramate dehydrogenase [Caldilineales bacterium]|nr:UDP-N-acetylmuramate dehydrogenase [Caldilineales bacterium]
MITVQSSSRTQHLQALAAFGRNGLQENAPLAPYTSFRIGGPAERLLIVQAIPDLLAALDYCHSEHVTFLMLGGGSNVLISDEGISGLVIVNQCRGVEWLDQPAGRQMALAESGVALAGLARASIARNLAGLGWAVSVPGTVGGAVVGNTGAHGGCVADNLQSVRLWTDGVVAEFAAADLQLGYRRSRLKDIVTKPSFGPVVLSATFLLEPDPEGEERARADAYLEHRRRTQPVDKSAGSIFKNPPGDFSGRLIEAAGLKGHRIGGASVSEQHANFIINHGQATAADVVALMNVIRARVFAQFGVVLEPEIQFIGDWQNSPKLSPIGDQ